MVLLFFGIKVNDYGFYVVHSLNPMEKMCSIESVDYFGVSRDVDFEQHKVRSLDAPNAGFVSHATLIL